MGLAHEKRRLKPVENSVLSTPNQKLGVGGRTGFNKDQLGSGGRTEGHRVVVSVVTWPYETTVYPSCPPVSR
jgi:hypothetical protein